MQIKKNQTIANRVPSANGIVPSVVDVEGVDAGGKVLTPEKKYSLSANALAVQDKMVNLYHNIMRTYHSEHGVVIQFIHCEQGGKDSWMVQMYSEVASVVLRKKVLLIDSDIKNPRTLQHYADKIEKSPSMGTLSDVFPEGIYKTQNEGLFVAHIASKGDGLDCESIFANKHNFQRIRSLFDIIVFDTPSIQESAMAFQLLNIVDGSILVVEVDKTRRAAAADAMRRIEAASGTVLGAVATKCRYPIPNILYKRM